MDGELASATVMSLLSQAGPIEWSQANTQLEGKRAKAFAFSLITSDVLIPHENNLIDLN